MAPSSCSSPPRVAIVTGGASGLGRALVRELVARGAVVVIADVDASRGTALEDELGGRARFRRTDVTSAEDVEALVAECFARDGRLDWMINNAGVGVLGEVRDMELRQWRRVMDVNVMGVAHGIQSAYPRMAAARSGRIVNMASIAGLIPTPTGAAYSASKHAIVAMSRALRMEARALGVSVTVACPSFIRTSFGDNAEYVGVERKQIFAAEDEDPAKQARIARAILDGAERNRAIVFTPAWLRVVWWLWRAAPWWMELTIGRGVMRRHRRWRKEP